jgi:hypothetical protein
MDAGLVALLAGSGWASGLNVYLVVLLLGVAGRTGLAEVPDALVRTDVLAIAGVLFALEFVIDKLPWLDSAWDTFHTAIRPLGAAAIGLLLTGEVETWQQVTGALGAGGLATAAHAAKATTRVAINTSPEPVSNVVVSVAEDGLVAMVVALAIANPILAIVVVLVLVLAGATLTIVLWRSVRRALARRRRRRGQQSVQPSAQRGPPAGPGGPPAGPGGPPAGPGGPPPSDPAP